VKKLLKILLAPLVWFKVWLIKKLLKLRARLQIKTLRSAIDDADENKKETGRKNMVVFNAHSGKYEPIQKRLLKNAANVTKNKSNKAMTPGRKKMMKQNKKKRIVDSDRVKQIEKKSLYVTE
jgi:hypothetical protein